jgi:hypothetical protein
MGTPPAPPWATVFYFFALKEMGLLPEWSAYLRFYKRFIDNVTGVLLVDPDPVKNERMWTKFQRDMNCWFGLEWVCKDPSTSINFMDSTITIMNGRLETTLFEKEQNLYLYIPPHSSHPCSVFTGLIFGQVLRIRLLCSKQSDADGRIGQFYSRLLTCGHTNDFLYSLCSAVPKRMCQTTYPSAPRSVNAYECRRRLSLWTKSSSIFNFTQKTLPITDLELEYGRALSRQKHVRNRFDMITISSSRMLY